MVDVLEMRNIKNRVVEEKSEIRVPVRDLVTARPPSVSLAKGFTGRIRGKLKIAIHSRIQNSRPMGYEKEVALYLVNKRGMFRLDIFGTVDGLKENLSRFRERDGRA